MTDFMPRNARGQYGSVNADHELRPQATARSIFEESDLRGSDEWNKSVLDFL